MKIRPIVKIHGGKFYLSNWIIEHFPKHYKNLTYIEPYCGGGSILLNKLPSKTEAINDLDPGIFVILTTLQNTPFEFINRLRGIKYSEDVFLNAKEKQFHTFDRNVDFAVNEFILRRMSRGGLKKAFAWSERQRGGRPGDENAWNTIINTLPHISKRIQGIQIFNEPAITFLSRWNKEDVLAYCDPTYLLSTRESKKAYDFEMTDKDHEELAMLLNQFKGNVLVSGYPSPMYDEIYSDWTYYQKEIVNHASQQKIKPTKIECLWANYHL